MVKHIFDSREYNILESENNSIKFFNPKDSNLYQIQPNTPEEIKSKKGEYSLWNLTRDKRVSGLYLKSSNNQVRIFLFDYLGQVYHLEITQDSVLIQFLHTKGLKPFKGKQTSKKGSKQLVVGLW
jgi:hypothetical protein